MVATAVALLYNTRALVSIYYPTLPYLTLPYPTLPATVLANGPAGSIIGHGLASVAVTGSGDERKTASYSNAGPHSKDHVCSVVQYLLPYPTLSATASVALTGSLEG